ncbi:MAG: uroporphyrinogen synthase [Variovorax sp.]|nr:uroporphyrinogen synthase [Variovorax sp.]
MSVSATRVIVTRPAREANRWIVDLQGAGLDAVALPLIDIAPVADAAPLRAAWSRLAGCAAVMFVSATAVDEFFRQRPANAPTMPRCWATGLGTARALRLAGVAPAAIDVPAAASGSFDSEALWLQVRPQVTPGARVLIVRGGDAAGHAAGRDWLAHEIAAAQASYDTVVAYRRVPPSFDGAALALAAEGAAGRAIWLFSSSEAIGNLRRALPGTGWHAGRAVATHARIAEAARATGFGTVVLSQPLKEALVASIESLA